MPLFPPKPIFWVFYLLVVYLIFCFFVGACLVIIPWLSWIWEENYFLYRLPVLQQVMLNPFARGAISGLGLLNICFGIYEIMAFRRWRRDGAGK